MGIREEGGLGNQQLGHKINRKRQKKNNIYQGKCGKVIKCCAGMPVLCV
jgi:hypothetical protein